MDWANMSRSERDAAYDNGNAVPDVAMLREARAQASLAFRNAHGRALDVPYGDQEKQCWDLFAGTRPSAPCLVFIHGGYWQQNSRETFSCLCEGVRAHGWSAAFVGYTLAPQASLTQIGGEISAALTWLAREGPRYGVAGKLLLSGWSAGGHLTALALGHPAVAAGMAISGVYELGPLRDTYLDEKLSLTDVEIAELSPLRLPPVMKPLAIAYGTAELARLVADSRDLHAHRCAAHAPGPLLPVAGANHFTVLDELRRGDGWLTRQLLDLAR
jgi:acetyl esterase/lipase